MKICKKCKNEYKDDYIYCPCCGKPYDETKKAVKTPSSIGDNSVGVIKKIWDVILYIFGGIMILGCLLTIMDSFLSSIVGIMFGLSLFKVFYDIIAEKTMIEEKIFKNC